MTRATPHTSLPNSPPAAGSLPKAKPARVTPMMAQYMGIKSDVGDEALLFYRMGDFYELFFDDAIKAAEALDIALTKRGKHQGADIPMCGVPVHAAETYLLRLIRKGFRVAVCEQTEDPAEAKKRGSKSVVKREVVRLVTPGTLTEEALLDARGANYILSIAQSRGGDMALAWADISDGSFHLCDISPDRIDSEIVALSPQEILLPESLFQDVEFMQKIEGDSNRGGRAFTPLPASKFDPRQSRRRLEINFNVASLDGFGSFSHNEVAAAGALLDYLELTQAGTPIRLSPPIKKASNGYMSIDPATRASLEIDKTQTGSRSGSLLSVIDRTVTGAGARRLAAFLARPLVDVDRINERLDGVSFFHERTSARETLRARLKEGGDLARAVSRLSLGRGGPRDMQIIGRSLKIGAAIYEDLSSIGEGETPKRIKSALEAISLKNKTALGALSDDIDTAFLQDVPLLARDGGFIAPGWHKGLDEAKQLRDESRKIVAGLQAGYADEAQVPHLKIKHNNVLGYFIEVTPKYGEHMLSLGAESRFIHRQTLVSGVRFTTTELADLDGRIRGAADQAVALELDIFLSFVARVTEEAALLRAVAEAISDLDVASALAVWADEDAAVRPKIDDSLSFHIEGGRHPVVDRALKKDGLASFTPNDCQLDAHGDAAPRLTLITGPNMAGKSTYLRQNALMFILAQAGSYVPASRAHIGVADSVYSRVGASDDLSRGRSTFMTEMIETATILNLAGERSFVILDEIGRGTATFDGLSIAWATAEHLHTVNKARALFATHYHELTGLIDQLEAASNACLHAKEWDGDLIFLHDVKPGAADKSYGIQVAKLAGLPDVAIIRAKDVLTRLEGEHDEAEDRLGGLPLFNSQTVTPPSKPSQIEHVIDRLSPDELSPREALDLIYELKAKLNREKA